MTYEMTVLLIGINVIGIVLKIYTNYKLRLMEGISDIYTFDASDKKVIGRL